MQLYLLKVDIERPPFMLYYTLINISAVEWECEQCWRAFRRGKCTVGLSFIWVHLAIKQQLSPRACETLPFAKQPEGVMLPVNEVSNKLTFNRVPVLPAVNNGARMFSSYKLRLAPLPGTVLNFKRNSLSSLHSGFSDRDGILGQLSTEVDNGWAPAHIYPMFV